MSIASTTHWSIPVFNGRPDWSNAAYRTVQPAPAADGWAEDPTPDTLALADRRRLMAHIRRASRDQTAFTYKTRAKAPDGAARTILVQGAYILSRDGCGDAITGFAQDITGVFLRKSAEQETLEKLNGFIESLPAGAVRVRDGKLNMNAATERITGYKRTDLPDLEAWFAKLYGDTSGKLLRIYQRQREDGFPEVVRAAIRRRDGEKRVLALRACEDPSGEIWIINDVTDRAALEAELIAARDRAEVAAAAKSEFLANMSHELRTPLTAIIGFTGLLTSLDDLAPLQRHWVTRVEEAGKSLLGIVNDVLDFSKLEGNAITLERETLDPRRLVENTVALVSPQIERKGISMTVRVAEDVPAALVGDLGRLRQILVNLLSNAVKFTDEGGVTLQLEREQTADGAAKLKASITDTGIGIPQSAQSQIFQRFVQADGSISRRFGGTGLGLAICARLVALMQGEIGVYSRPGEGATFWFTLPLVEAAMTPETAADQGPVDLAAIRILLVEDAEPNQELITTVLRSAGVEVDLAVNGAEAVEAVQTSRYDLILMDVQMPIMGGVEATRRIRALGGAWSRIPIVALSANVLPEQVDTYHQAGMDDHLAKPINPRDMLSTIARWVDAADETATTASVASQ